MQVFALHRLVEHHAYGRRLGTHRERDADVADDWADDVAGPLAAAAVPFAAAQPNGRRVHGFLPERSESFPLKRHVAVFDLAAGKEGLQPVVRGARQQHAAQDLAALVGRQRRFDRRTAHEAVAVVEQLGKRAGDAHFGRNARCRLRQAGRERTGLETPRQLAAKHRCERVDFRFRARCAPARDGLERVDGIGQGERMPLGDERAEPAREAREFGDVGWLRHQGNGS